MADSTDNNQSPDEIRREIDQARESMRQTLDALQVKLDPERLKQQATGAVRNATVGRVEELADNASQTMKGVGTDVLDTIKRNPFPAALAAIGIGWLFMESRKNDNRESSPRYYGQSSRYRSGYYDYDYGRREDYDLQARQPRAADRVRDTAGRVQDRAGEMTDRMQDKAGEMADRVQDKAGQIADTVQDTASDVADRVQTKASEMADQAQYQAARAKSRMQDMLDENPLLLGAAAVALGAAIGMSLPHTPQEDQLLGSARDTIMDKAQGAAKDTMQKVQSVAQEAGNAAKEAAKDEAQKQNLTTS